MATVVTKLLHCVEPDVAVFGKKDFQQWRLLHRMVRLGVTCMVYDAFEDWFYIPVCSSLCVKVHL